MSRLQSILAPNSNIQRRSNTRFAKRTLMVAGVPGRSREFWR